KNTLQNYRQNILKNLKVSLFLSEHYFLYFKNFNSMSVSPKKHLGQHFLIDLNICRKIVNQYLNYSGNHNVLEIGPGMGAITQFLIEIENIDLHVMEIDKESVAYLQITYPALKDKIHPYDFLKT